MSDTTDAPDAIEPSPELTRLLAFAREDVPASNAWEVLSAQIVAAATTGTHQPGPDFAQDPLKSEGELDGAGEPGASTGAGGASPRGDVIGGETVGGGVVERGVTSGGAGAVKVGGPMLLSGAALKAVGLVVVAGGLGTGAWYQWAERGSERTPAGSAAPVNPAPVNPAPQSGEGLAPPVVVPEPEQGVPLADGPAAAAPATDVPVGEPAENRVAGDGQRGVAGASSRELQNPRVAAPSELSLLARARESLTSNPERTLALCRRHAQLYPQGQLAQEREVLLIEALERLKRDKEAAQRRQEFGKLFPDSPHQSRVKPQ